jgi:hypothetical protein
MIWLFLAAFLTGIFSAMGLGGGMILIIALTLFFGYPQLEAQGINLVYFIPIALIAVIIHLKNGRADLKKLFPAVICGIVFSVLGAYGAVFLGSDLLRKAFGIFLLVSSLFELKGYKCDKM